MKNVFIAGRISAMNRISTIIANYNYGDYVSTAIKSAIAAGCGFKHKVVVIDDGSTDGSVEKVKELISFNSVYYSDKLDCNIYTSDVVDLLVSENKGASNARNIGIKHVWSSTDFYHILDADDFVSNDKLQKMIKKMSEPEIGIVYGDYYISRPLYNKYEYKQPYDILELTKQCIIHSGSLIRKKYLEAVLLSNGDIYDRELHGPASKAFKGCTEDYDLWLRLSKVCVATHVPEPLTFVREHGRNQSSKMTGEIFQINAERMRAKR